MYRRKYSRRRRYTGTFSRKKKVFRRSPRSTVLGRTIRKLGGMPRNDHITRNVSKSGLISQPTFRRPPEISAPSMRPFMNITRPSSSRQRLSSTESIVSALHNLQQSVGSTAETAQDYANMALQQAKENAYSYGSAAFQTAAQMAKAKIAAAATGYANQYLPGGWQNYLPPGGVP